jgi:hypothetical protein
LTSLALWKRSFIPNGEATSETQGQSFFHPEACWGMLRVIARYAAVKTIGCPFVITIVCS